MVRTGIALSPGYHPSLAATPIIALWSGLFRCQSAAGFDPLFGFVPPFGPSGNSKLSVFIRKYKASEAFLFLVLLRVLRTQVRFSLDHPSVEVFSKALLE